MTLTIIGRGSIRPADYKNFSAGINAIQGHIFTDRINGENAGVYASEVMYLATSLLTATDTYDRIEKPENFRSVAMKGIKKISSLRNVEPVAYAYMVKSLQMLQEIGLYKDGVN